MSALRSTRWWKRKTWTSKELCVISLINTRLMSKSRMALSTPRVVAPLKLSTQQWSYLTRDRSNLKQELATRKESKRHPLWYRRNSMTKNRSNPWDLQVTEDQLALHQGWNLLDLTWQLDSLQRVHQTKQEEAWKPLQEQILQMRVWYPEQTRQRKRRQENLRWLRQRRPQWATAVDRWKSEPKTEQDL